VNTARVWGLSGEAEIFLVAPVSGQIGRGVESTNGAFEIVLNRAWPCSSRLVPVAAPIGFSGDFSSVGASVFSASPFLEQMAAGLQKRQKSGVRRRLA